MSKKLLVVSYYFAPECKVASIRWTKLGKFLAKLGWVVDVVTKDGYVKCDTLLERDSAAFNNIIRLPHGNAKFSVSPTDSKPEKKPLPTGIIGAIKRSRPVKWLRQQIKTRQALAFDYERALDFAGQFSKAMDDGIVNPGEYDAVVCTFGPSCDTLIALEIKKRFPNVKLVMDFRDPMVTVNVIGKLRKTYSRLQTEVCEAADVITSVSKGCLDHVCAGKHADKAVVIPNGYDLEDLGRLPEISNGSDKYSLVYLGTLYGGKRDLTPLFVAISELVRNGEMKKEDIVFHYAGNSFNVLNGLAAKTELTDIVVDHDFIPREESLALQKNSRVLVLASWNLKGEEGVLTGKFLEYMMMERPICALVSGNLPGSEIRTIIEEGRLGIVYEQPTAKADYKALCDWLRKDYARFKAGLDVEFEPSEDVVGRYSYPSVAEKLDMLLAKGSSAIR